MIILADDDPEDSELVNEALHRNHFSGETVMAEIGQLLMDLLHSPATANPQLILLDLNMPRKSGFEALKEIRSDEDLKAIPVVVLTASSNSNDEVRCFELGCNLYLRKPTLPQEYDALVRLIARFLF